MGNQQSTQKCNFEDVQCFIRDGCIIISTLPDNEQQCLIERTVDYKEEINIINSLLTSNKQITIVVYGRNSNDDTVYKKYEQLIQLGFMNVFIYTGGLFEWLCLQDIYGNDEFKTTSEELDILKYKSSSITKSLLLKN